MSRSVRRPRKIQADEEVQKLKAEKLERKKLAREKNLQDWHKQPKGVKMVAYFIFAIPLGLILLIGIAGYNAPPNVNISNEASLSNYKTDSEFMTLSGQVTTLHSPKLTINDESIMFDEQGKFSHKVPLTEGRSSIRVAVTSEKGLATKEYKVYRTTAAELTARKIKAEKAAAEKKRKADLLAIEKKKAAEEQALRKRQKAINAMPICDGIRIKSSCRTDDVVYKTYIYYPAVAEKTHTVTDTTYREEVTGYCTLCNDGTYSPSCATGRGACSHHGGVAQWNAPRTSRVPVYTKRVVVDAPAVAERYEKVLDPTYN